MINYPVRAKYTNPQGEWWIVRFEDRNNGPVIERSPDAPWLIGDRKSWLPVDSLSYGGVPLSRIWEILGPDTFEYVPSQEGDRDDDI